VDAFGQWAMQDWTGKVKTVDELKAAWAEEDATLNPLFDNVSRYGGYKAKQVSATGYFRTEKIDCKWWLVDPEGYLFLSVGVNHMVSSVHTRIKGRENIYEQVREGDNYADFYGWNLEKRYGDQVYKAWVDKAAQRMQAWGLNTVGNWSSNEITQADKVPFVLQLNGLQIEKGVMGFVDIYDSEYAENIDKAIADLTKQYKDNPWLLGYFVGNEPPWPGQEAILCDRILNGKNTPIKQVLQAYISAHGDSPETKRNFIHQTFSKFLELVNLTLKKHDPNHLNLGIRFGAGFPDGLLPMIRKHFDVFSFNNYSIQPSAWLMNQIASETDLPVLIGEYHFGVPERGMGPGIVQVANQEERANAYRFYNEQGYSHPSLVGAHWFQWLDQSNTGRDDGENYSIGLLDITDRPYPELIKAIQETSKHLYEIHSGERKPYNVMPKWISY
jgi:hypothetical protein